jgi:phosphoribosylformylglycinamidine synthase
MSSPNVASKRWAFEQYDSVVGSRTVRRPEQADAAVLLVPESDRAIAVSIDGNGRRVACEPYAGTVEAVLECAANLACTGAEPLGLTNCLNFGNPEKPGVAWQLTRAVEGLAAACEALGVPVVGGNVSLYNETAEGPIYPTPVVGMVGELPYAEAVPGIALREGDAIGLLGPFRPSLAGSELAKQRGKLGRGLPEPDIEAVKTAHAAVRAAVRGETVSSVHDISDGGLACALAEMAIAGGIGARIDLAPLIGAETDPEDALFGEGPGGFLLAGEEAALESLGAAILGEAGGSQIEISAGALSIAVGVGDAGTAWRSLGERLS